MEKLTNKEEEVMQVIWLLQKGFVKDFMEQMPEPKPHYNTLSTMVRNLEEKGYVGHTQYGNTYEYYPLVTKEQYKETFLMKVLNTYFDNSYKNLVSFFAKEKQISAEELKEIIEMIEKRKSS